MTWRGIMGVVENVSLRNHVLWQIQLWGSLALLSVVKTTVLKIKITFTVFGIGY